MLIPPPPAPPKDGAPALFAPGLENRAAPLAPICDTPPDAQEAEGDRPRKRGDGGRAVTRCICAFFWLLGSICVVLLLRATLLV